MKKIKLIIKNSKPKCLWKMESLLGEGTLWVSQLNSIIFLDIKRKKIFILNIKTNKRKILKLDKEIGFISHINKSIFILGLSSELRIVDLKNMEIYQTKIHFCHKSKLKS